MYVFSLQHWTGHPLTLDFSIYSQSHQGHGLIFAIKVKMISYHFPLTVIEIKLESIKKLKEERTKALSITHFGIFPSTPFYVCIFFEVVITIGYISY